MASNVLAIPLAYIQIETSSNQDWVESFKYVVDDGTDAVDTMPQLDLRGIAFEMEVRRSRDDHEVLIHATTENHQLAIGAFPNYGFLLFAIPVTEMIERVPGHYVADVVAKDGTFVRKIMDITLTITDGVTKWTPEEMANFPNLTAHQYQETPPSE